MHPLTRQMLNLVKTDRRSRAKLARKAGVDESAFYAWERGHTPLFFTMEAMLQTLGYKLEIVRNGTTATEKTE